MSCPEGRFPPASRLRTPAEFKAVFSSGRKSSDTHFVILARPNGTPCPRLGFAIARSRIPRATARNRVKRVVREYFRAHQAALGGVDIVVMAHPRAAAGEARALRDSLEKHWKRMAPWAGS